ncbi:MAG TPA: ABC transporter permease [Vicinamibacterales bacterium]|nr:ABC transporter permease [Vicinamibacterales bacterium]
MTSRQPSRFQFLVVKLLLFLYPPRFRREFGSAMLDDLDERLRDTSTFRAMRDLAASGVREWFAPTHRPGLASRTGGGSRPATHLRDDLRADLRGAFRGLVRRPGSSFAVIAILALGIGANTAIFSVVNAVLVRPMPLGDPGRLVSVWEDNVEQGTFGDKSSPATYFAWRDRITAFHDVATYGSGAATLTDRGAAEIVPASTVSGNFFDVIGVPAEFGRTFRDEELWSDTTPVVMLSDALWARRFNRDRSVIGSRIEINEEPYEVIGIVSAGREFPERNTDLWVTFRWDRSAPQKRWFREEHYLQVLARLRDGVSVDDARAEFVAVNDRLRQEWPDTNRPLRVTLLPMQQRLAGDARLPLQILLGSTVTLLLLACANVANLLLVRASGRNREVAVRAALGAGRGRIVRQMITESLTLAVAGGTAGVALGLWGIRGLIAMQPPDGWRVTEAPLDGRVLLFALVVTLATGVLFGLMPSLRASATNGIVALRDGSRTSGGVEHRRASRALVMAEIALAVVLVTGAGLLLRSFITLRQVDPGFQTDHRLAAQIVLPKRYARDGQILDLVDRIVTSLNAIPGVNATTYMSRLPLNGTSASLDEFTIEGQSAPVPGGYLGERAVGPNYFEVFGVPVLRGRAFDAGDRLGAEWVMVINREAARRFFPTSDPVGQRITWDQKPNAQTRWYRIVGVVGDEHQFSMRDAPHIEAFIPFRQLATTRVSFVLDAPRAGPGLAREMRDAITAIDPHLPLYRVQALDEIYSASLGRDRFLLTLVAAFAGLALLLASMGVYGVTAEATSQRTQEIGIRVALGATPGEIAGLVLRQGLVLAALGIVAGLGAAAAATRVMAGVLFGVEPLDLTTFAVVAVVLGLAALVASAMPARRAAALDPLLALKRE